MKRVRHVLDLFALPSFTKPNKSDPAKQSHEAGCHLSKLTQVFLIHTWARSHKRGGVCSIWPITNMDWAVGGSRVACYKYKERTNNSERSDRTEKERKWEERSENCLLSPRCFIALDTHIKTHIKYTHLCTNLKVCAQVYTYTHTHTTILSNLPRSHEYDWPFFHCNAESA